MIQNTIQLLGLTAKDKITGIEGVIDSVCFDLYGCVQVSIAPKAKPDGDIPSGRWFDVSRVDTTDQRVMPVPGFRAKDDRPENYDKGPAHKAPPR